jgi:ribosomal protein S18 acetylase RimI-like enzyme
MPSRHGGHVVTLDVLASDRRRGIGRALLSGIEERLRKAGARRIHLETAEDNAAALVFYAALGYEPVARLPEYYGPGQPAIRLKKEY